MLPTLRLGFLVTPPGLRAAMYSAKFVTDWHTPLVMQSALARFIDDGDFVRHVRRVRKVYGTRRELLRHALAEDFAEHLELLPSTNGLHVTALARTASVSQIERCVERLADADVAAQELSMFRVDQPALAGFALGYGGIATKDILEGLGRLQQHLESSIVRSRRRSQ